MATYKRPGVFIEESLKPLSQTVNVSGSSVAAFAGIHYKGPVGPVLISSWTQFVALYGGFSPDPTQFLAHAVYQFFNNGGRNAYIVRAVNANAVAASVILNDTGLTIPLLTVTAKDVGAYPTTNYFITTEKTDPDQAGATDLRFNLYVHDGGSTSAFIVERFFDMSMDPADPRYAPPIINAPDTGSQRIKVAHTGITTWTLVRAHPAIAAGVAMTAGTDGTGVPPIDTAAKTLESLDSSPLIVLNLPAITDVTILSSVITWAAGLQTVFVVVDVAPFTTSQALTVTAMGAMPAALGHSSYSAIYGPWINVDDPASTAPGALRSLPPGGAVIGQYQQTDATRGIQKPPAGVGTALTGVLSLDTKLFSVDLETLFGKGVNVIKPLPGIGYCIYGARTASLASADRYVSVRRVLMAIKKDLLDGTRWAVFEPNDSLLWSRMTGVIEDYLTTAQASGLLAGTIPAQGFYVTVDSTNNTVATVAAGEVHAEIGLALLTPAEFVIIKIGQYAGSAVTTESPV
jgi:uncharacterized protein